MDIGLDFGQIGFGPMRWRGQVGRHLGAQVLNLAVEPEQGIGRRRSHRRGGAHRFAVIVIVAVVGRVIVLHFEVVGRH